MKASGVHLESVAIFVEGDKCILHTLELEDDNHHWRNKHTMYNLLYILAHVPLFKRTCSIHIELLVTDLAGGVPL